MKDIFHPLMLLSCRCSWSDSGRGQPFFVVLTTLEN
nr:MAG TPA: hypothetical protein [Caudoviricetes sp.]